MQPSAVSSFETPSTSSFAKTISKRVSRPSSRETSETTSKGVTPRSSASDWMLRPISSGWLAYSVIVTVFQPGSIHLRESNCSVTRARQARSAKSFGRSAWGKAASSAKAGI